jgi:WD40 repeat protein
MPAEPSLQDHVTHYDTGAPVAALGWIDERACFALGDGRVVVSGENGFDVHPADGDIGILVAAPSKNGLLVGRDDGTVARFSVDGGFTPLAETGGAWIDTLVAHTDGSFAYSYGRKVAVCDAKGRNHLFDAPSSVRGLTFAPKGFRLGIAHYNGVTLWYPGTNAKPEVLEWKGSHIDITWSADGRWIVTTMQENSLHVFRLLPEKTDLRMANYPGKIRSLSWTHDGRQLATSGAEAAILWPFDGKDGPMNRRPRECGLRPARVTQVAAHPASPVLAVGYQDGAVLLVRLTDDQVLYVDSGGGGAVSALAWNQSGKILSFSDADGRLGILRLP